MKTEIMGIRLVGAGAIDAPFDACGMNASRGWSQACPQYDWYGTGRKLADALRSRANILLTGDVASGLRYLELRLGETARLMCSDRLNESGIDALVESSYTGRTIIIEGVDRLTSWVQNGILDLLEDAGASARNGSPFRVISTARRSLDDLVARGDFNRGLGLRLSTLTIPIPHRGAVGASDTYLVPGQEAWEVDPLYPVRLRTT